MLTSAKPRIAEDHQQLPPETYLGLRVEASRHSMAHSNFPGGIWYGKVEGFPVTEPEWKPEVALRNAKASIESGEFALQLLTSIRCHENMQASGAIRVDLEVRIERERDLLRKVLPLVKDLESKAFAAIARETVAAA